jgi:hypothetical protein
MRRESRGLRIFAIVWAVLQFALPASAMLGDARLAVASSDKAHVEEGPGGDCAPSHSPDCVVCKHLSISSLGAAPLTAALGDHGRKRALRSRTVGYARPATGVTLPRAPPALY